MKKHILEYQDKKEREREVFQNKESEIKRCKEKVRDSDAKK